MNLVKSKQMDEKELIEELRRLREEKELSEEEIARTLKRNQEEKREKEELEETEDDPEEDEEESLEERLAGVEGTKKKDDQYKVVSTGLYDSADKSLYDDDNDLYDTGNDLYDGSEPNEDTDNLFGESTDISQLYNKDDEPKDPFAIKDPNDLSQLYQK
jgi:hypothetical protein